LFPDLDTDVAPEPVIFIVPVVVIDEVLPPFAVRVMLDTVPVGIAVLPKSPDALVVTILVPEPAKSVILAPPVTCKVFAIEFISVFIPTLLLSN
jgi:hypothetical protein